MRVISYQYISQLFRNNNIAITMAVFSIAIGVFISLLSEQTLLFVGVLLIGLPFVALVISKRTRNKTVVFMLVLLPLISILKAVTGTRFAPLTFDLGLFFACVLYLGEGVFWHKIRLGNLDILLLFLWGLAFLQIFNPNVPNLQSGIEGFRKFIFMSITFYLGRHLLRLRDFRLFGKGMMLFSIPVVIYGIKQFFVMWPIDYRLIELSTSSSTTFLMGGWIRPFSTMSGPFQLGLYLMVLLLLTLSILKTKVNHPYLRSLVIGFLILEIILLLMTRTKGNWIGLLVGISILFILQSRRNPVRVILKLSGFSLFSGIIIIFMLSQVSGNTLTVLNDALFAITHPLQAPTFIYRLELWQDTIIPAIQKQPFLGYGTGSAGEGLQNLYEGTQSLFFFSHNLYIKIWLEMGLVGLIVFLWIVSESLWRGLRQLRRPVTINSEAGLLLRWSFAVVVAFLVGGVVIPTLDAYPINYYFWLLLGLLSRPKILEIS